jgi:anti-sigma B factor antagonist
MPRVLSHTSPPDATAMPALSFPVSLINGVAVVTTPDEIDISNASLLREALVTATHSAVQAVVVDMSGTEYCDSTGLNVLVRAQKKAEPDGVELRLVVRASAVQRMLTVTGVAGLFRVFADLDEATRAA